MSETKINLDAFLERNSHWNDNTEAKDTWVQIESEKISDNATERHLGISESKPVGEKASQAISIEQEPLSIDKEIEAWLKEVHEEIKEANPVQSQEENISEIPTKKHSLSLDSLLNNAKETETKAEVKQETSEVNQPVKQTGENNDTENSKPTKTQAAEEKEVFWNYESKFSSQSTKILERLRMPKTRVGMLASLILVSAIAIGWLMYTNPKTHSISNYKASVKTIYNDIKKWDISDQSQPWPTGITGEIEDVSRKDNIVNQDISTEHLADDNKGEKEPRKREDIKKENLKNFLIENYK